MKKLFILAALLMASTAAHAGNLISFEIEGHHIHVAVPKNCNSLSCLQISGVNGSGFGNFKKHNDDDDVADNSPAPVQSAPAPAPAPAPVVTPAQVAPVAAAIAPVVAAVAPTVTTAAPVAPQPAAVAPAQVAAPAPVAVAPVAPAPAPVAAAPVSDPNSPLGVWATEENKGNVRIEPCGANLCGYAVKTGEKILISMKPSGSKWTGQIHDPDSGSNYDSTFAMKGTNALKVQGCAFGGMFCGGQTWKRVS